MRRPILFTALAAVTLLGFTACSAPTADAEGSAGQSSTAAPEASATPTPTSTPEPTASPLPAADFAGDWTGIATQGAVTHDVTLSLTESGGGYSGTIRHDELQCAGTLNDGVVTAGVLTIQKHIDGVSNCIVDLEVILTPVDAETIRYDTEVSTALLTRP
jgi:hypothetical protein